MEIVVYILGALVVACLTTTYKMLKKIQVMEATLTVTAMALEMISLILKQHDDDLKGEEDSDSEQE